MPTPISASDTATGPIRVLLLGRLEVGPADLADDLVGDVEPKLAAGRDRFDTDGEPYDCVVVSTDRARSNDWAAEIQSVAPTVPVLVVTDDEEYDLQSAFEAGASDVVRRSEDWPASLEHRIRTVVTRGRSKDLARYERIVETVDDGIYTLDENFEISWVNQAAVSMLGYPRDELVGSHASLLTSDETLEEAAMISQELLAGDRDVGRLDTELETATGDRIPIETNFTMMPLRDGGHGQVGVFRDITERKEYERVLEALHDSTRTLLRAKSWADVGQVVRDTATELLDITTVVYCYDGSANVLRPASNPPSAIRGLADGVPVDSADGSPVWRAFLDETPVTPDEDVGDIPASRCYPLGEHGVLAAVADVEGVDEKTDRLLGLLAATTEAALDRIQREDALRERDRKLERRNDRLTKLNRINEVIRGIDRILVQAETREEIEDAVCEQLARDDRWAFVWIGELAAGDNELVPRTWAGDGEGYLDRFDLRVEDTDEPAARVARRGEPVVVSNVSGRFRDEPWRKRALSHDFQSVVSVPVDYGNLSYGVLTVYASGSGAFDGTTRTVFGELGETIAHAINGVETKQSLLSDHSVELDLRVDDEDDLLVRLARAAGTELEFVDFIPKAGGETAAFFNASAVDPDRIVAVGEEFFSVGAVQHLADRDGDGVYEVTLKTATVASTLRDYGALTRRIHADEHGLNAIIELPRTTDVRDFVELLRGTHPSTKLVARRNQFRSDTDEDGFRSALEEALTDRQLEVFRTAYRLGYFEWPRRHSGQEVAAQLDISQPTFNRHLRESQRKLVGQFFDSDD